MGKIAFVFSGQGAQFSGMGQSFYESIDSVRALYDAAEEIRPGTKAQSFSGTADELKQTVNTQPCLYLACIAAAEALRANGINADVCAGFSLGELAALSYSGVYSAIDGLKIVMQRAQLMDKAAHDMPEEPAMAAVMKLDAAKIEEICSGIDGVYPANYNSPAQTVISGVKSGVAAFKEASGATLIDLPVSGAFHTPYMASASEGFAQFLGTMQFTAPSIPTYADLTGREYAELIGDGDVSAKITESLAAQIQSPVRWQTAVENMIADGVDTFVECGAGKTLCNLIKKIDKSVKVFPVQDAETLAAAVAGILGE